MLLQMQAFGRTLSTSLGGVKAFTSMVGDTKASNDPQICFIDFNGVDVATTSFLRESIVAYRNHARSHWNTIYPVVANLNADIEEELDYFLRTQGDVLVTCKLKNGNEQPSSVKIIGRLDGKQEIALRAVIDKGNADAITLAQDYNQEGVSTTAWNNRLSALAAKGLLIESNAGRSKRYRPVLERLSYGT